jgi:hypothetical protein
MIRGGLVWPPRFLAQAEKAITYHLITITNMMEQMSKAPEADKAALKPFLPQIKKKLDAE